MLSDVLTGERYRWGTHKFVNSIAKLRRLSEKLLRWDQSAFVNVPETELHITIVQSGGSAEFKIQKYLLPRNEGKAAVSDTVICTCPPGGTVFFSAR